MFVLSAFDLRSRTYKLSALNKFVQPSAAETQLLAFAAERRAAVVPF